MLIDAKTGKPQYNANELEGMRNKEGVLRAQRLTPEEEARAKQEEMRVQQEKRIALENEKKKESAWTETKLQILALQGAHKRTSETKDPKEFDMPAGSIRENLAKVDPVLFERFGEPREFIEDMNMILTGFENEKIVVEGNEMQEINEFGKKYLLGLLIQKHIFEQGFSISIDESNQPVLRDEKPNPNSKRQEQMQGLQDALKQFEFSHSVRNILKKNDNSSLLADYIAASTHEKHPNLVHYRNSLARKLGITTPNISEEQTKIIVESTTLTPEEKSFLLAWKDTRKDAALIKVQDRQERFVKYARENTDQKTPETHLKELMERPFTKSAQLLAGGAIGGALLYFAYKQMKKGGVWGTISGLIAGLIGGAIMLPLGDKAWQALGLGDTLKDRLEGKPVDRDQARDNPFANIDANIVKPTKDLWERLAARLANGAQGIEILMNPEVGQSIATAYPVYSMLHSLNPDETRVGGKYESPDVGIPINDINTSLGKLRTSPNQKAQLNTLLRNTWERYQKTADYQRKNDQERRKISLNSMLKEIDKEDGWLNTVIDAVSSVPEKDAAMRVIGQNPKEWGNMKVRDLYTYFIDTSTENTQLRKLLEEYSTKYPDKGNPTEIIKKYLVSIEISKDSDLTLREFLQK